MKYLIIAAILLGTIAATSCKKKEIEPVVAAMAGVTVTDSTVVIDTAIVDTVVIDTVIVPDTVVVVDTVQSITWTFDGVTYEGEDIETFTIASQASEFTIRAMDGFYPNYTQEVQLMFMYWDAQVFTYDSTTCSNSDPDSTGGIGLYMAAGSVYQTGYNEMGNTVIDVTKYESGRVSGVFHGDISEGYSWNPNDVKYITGEFKNIKI